MEGTSVSVPVVHDEPPIVSTTIPLTQVPVIDPSKLLSRDRRGPELGQLRSPCRELGRCQGQDRLPEYMKAEGMSQRRLVTSEITKGDMDVERAGWMQGGAATSPSAACKLPMRCTKDCVFAPHFPVDAPQKFASVCKAPEASIVNERLQEKRDVLPLYSRANTPLEKKASTLRDFLRIVSNIPSEYGGGLLFLCLGYMRSQAKNGTALINFQSGSLLSFGQAFDKIFLEEMAHITEFMLCFILALMLAWRQHPGVQIFCVVVLICAPLFYFLKLVRNASGVDVACGSFKLPLIWFATLGALGLSLICGLVTLLAVYFFWRFINKRSPRFEETKPSLDGPSETLKDELVDLCIQ